MTTILAMTTVPAIPPTMNAIRVHRYGGPEELILEPAPVPTPAADEVLLRVCAAGVLPADWKMRQGFFHAHNPATFPYIPGSAVAGVVVALGEAVTGLEVGQPVFGCTPYGACAEFTAASVDSLALKPEAICFDQAATISGGATTAWTALFDDGDLQPGQHVLIHGAAGGVGSYAVQVAQWKGARVSATTSTGNVDFVRSLGAETVVDYTTMRFEEAVHDVDLVLDCVGGETLARSWPVVKAGGTLVTLVQPPHSPADADVRAIFGGRLPTADMLQTVANLITDGHVKPAPVRPFPMHEVRQAHRLSQLGHGRGRIVLHTDYCRQG